jgi:pimeloyl-ACP methyl ester carboxylesterase
MAMFTSLDGTRLHYEVVGDGPVLVLHLGAGCDAELWRAAGYVDALARTHRCVLFDHRGHGLSDHPTGAVANHLDRYVDDVVALVRHLGLARIRFFGWSSAVIVGLKAAEQHPSLFEALVLFGPLPTRVPEDQLQSNVAKRVAALRDNGWWLLLDAMIPAEPNPVPQWMIDRIVATDIEPYIGWSEARASWNWSPWDALPRVTTPTMLICGELEDPDDHMGSAAALMANATNVRVPNAEHINAFLDVGFALPLIESFLERVSMSTGA